MMKKTLAGLALLAPWMAAQEPAPGGKIRVLFTYGGHDFERKPMFEMLDGMTDLAWTRCELPREMDRLRPGLEKEFDVLLRYDMVPRVSPEQQEAFLELMKTSGIGLLALHHNLGAHPGWDVYSSIIGGRFIFKPCEIGGRSYPKSGWAHDQDLKVLVVDRDHPITKGVEDFVIHDEVYNNYYAAPDVKLLLKTDHPRNDPTLAWVKEFGKSRVFYLQLGHDSKAWAHPAFRKILLQGIRWLARR